MYSNKLRKGIKGKISESPWVRFNTQTKEVLTANDILQSSEWYVDKSWFYKIHYVYTRMNIKKDIDNWKAFGVLLSRAMDWLEEWNVLSRKRLDDYWWMMSDRTFKTYRSIWISNNMVHKRKNGVYVLNPNIMKFWTKLDQSIYDLFSWQN